MNKAAVESALSPFLAELTSLIRDGFEDYHREYAAVSHKHNPRTRASIIHDHIFDYAKARLLAISQFKRIPTKIRNLLDFSGMFVLQFKKLSRKLRTSNIPTQLSLNFDGQREVSELPGIPPSLPRLALGYVPSANWTSIDGIYLTYSRSKKLIWYLDLSGETGSQTLFHTPPDVIVPQPAQRVIRAKVKRRKRDDESAASV